jgi:hypothetical protein
MRQLPSGAHWPRGAARTTAAVRHCIRLGAALSYCLLMVCGSAFAQGFPGGGGGFPGGGGGPHGGHGPPPGDAAQRPPPQTVKLPDPLEGLLRAAHELRGTMMLDAAQTQRFGEMQADLRDAIDKRRALVPKPTDLAQVPNPALLFIQDMAGAESALGATLDKLSRSMQATYEALNEQQRKIFVEKMTGALSPIGPP